MQIEFDDTPDETGKGRVIVNGRYYGLPVEAVRELQRMKKTINRAQNYVCAENSEFCGELAEILAATRVPNAGLGAELKPEDYGLPPYPEGEVVEPCVCGSWPGGKCFRCKVVPNAKSTGVPPTDATKEQ